MNDSTPRRSAPSSRPAAVREMSAAEALRALSTTDTDPSGLSRRRFLQLLGYGAGAGLVAGGLGPALLPNMLPGALQEAWAGTPIGPTDGILVLVGQIGGCDGLNTVVPHTSSAYQQQHGSLAFNGSQVLPLTPTIGLHPSLTFLKSLYDAGEVAVVQGVGYPNPDLSHFSSMGIWMHGRAGTSVGETGWIGRWMDGRGVDGMFTAATIGNGLPLHMVGATTRGSAIPHWGLAFGGGTDEHDLWMYDGISAMSSATAGRGAWHDTVARSLAGMIDIGQEVTPVFSREIPGSDIEQRLTVAARLINADIGLRVIDASQDGYDTHSGQPAELATLLGDLDRGLRAFFTSLDDRFRSRVTVMTYSEFGRTSWANDSSGTDHGTANNMFVIGRAVKGGLYGAQPSLTGLERWDRMPFSVDFRSVYASMIDGWLGGGSSTVLGGTFTSLPLFRSGPGQGAVGGSSPAPAAGDFVGITPYRLYDSRTVPRSLPLGAGTAAEVPVVGLGGVPATGVTAVALNVVATGASTPTSLRVWPAGEARPDAEHMSSPAGRSVPNLLVVKPGAGGRIHVENDLGTAHCVVDITGYFRTTTASRLQTITPFRALDTRTGTGGRSVALGPTTSFDVLVRGVGGVPVTAESVVLNLCAVQPTAGGFLCAYPTGQTRPGTANVNFAAGQTVPNMVMVRVGANNRVTVYNQNGNTHCVVDVVGYFAAGAPGRFTPLPTTRVLDTRSDHGGSGPVGPASTTSLTVLGRGGVPASGVSAVTLNIAAHSPTANTFITAFPAGSARPGTANLNPLVGAHVSNMAVVKVGAGGAVQLFNNAGRVDLAVDVMGWFSG